MPQTAGSRLALACVGFVVIAALASQRVPVEAATDPSLNPDEARQTAPFVISMPGGEISLTGFHCGIISEPSTSAFVDELDFTETPPTIGLELVLDAGGMPPLTGPGLGDDIAIAEMKSPLSARLNRIIVEGGPFSLTDGGGMEEVSLPEASMNVADLVNRCHP